MNRRNCCKVINEMILEIPSSESNLITQLNKDSINASYKAPEETIQWKRVSETLQKYIPIPKQLWEFKVLSIFTNKSINEIRKML